MTEVNAYNIVKRIPSLKDRVLTFFGVIDNVRSVLANCGIIRDVCNHGVLIEYIEGHTLEQCYSTLEHEVLEEMHDELYETLGMLHTEALIAHGDPYSNNIMVWEGGRKFKLIDFSHPIFKQDVDELRWEMEMIKDRETLQFVFEQPRGATVSQRYSSWQNSPSSSVEQGFVGYS